MSARRYPLRQSHPQDRDQDDAQSISLADSLGAAMLTDSASLPPTPAHYDQNFGPSSVGSGASMNGRAMNQYQQPGRFMQNSPPPASPSTDNTDHFPSGQGQYPASGSMSITQRNRMSNDSVHTMPAASVRNPNQQGGGHHHRRSSTTDGNPNASRQSPQSMAASINASTIHPSPQSVRALRGDPGMQMGKPMPSLPRHSLPASIAPSPSAHAAQQRARAAYTRPIYPALLSLVASAFQARIPLSPRAKNTLMYKDTFDGREAVTTLCAIIKTTDRNLALLLGRALDAQKFFHDVTYDHRLRDSSSEVYQFRTKLPTPFMSGDEIAGAKNGNAQAGPSSGPGGRPPPNPTMANGKSLSSSTTDTHHTGTTGATASGSAIPPVPSLSDSHASANSAALSPVSTADDHGNTPLPQLPLPNSDNVSILTDSVGQHSSTSPSTPIPSHAQPGAGAAAPKHEALDAATAAATAAAAASSDDTIPLPSGVFTLLTECYSPTCTRDKLCYSIACPKRLEQQARLNLQMEPVLKRTVSTESLGDLVVSHDVSFGEGLSC